MRKFCSVPAIAGAIALGGCSFSTVFTDHAEDYNYTVEDTANRQLLTNILRAKDERPLHFTAISQLRGQQAVEFSGGASANLAFGGDAKNAHTGMPSIGGKRNSTDSMDVAILDNQEFIRGLTKPIDIERVKYYMDREYSIQMLLMLFVEKYDKLQVTVEVTKQVDGKITEKVKSRKLLSTDYNDPRSPSFERFLSTIQHIDEKDTRIVEFADADKEVGPELELKSATELRQLAAVHAAGLKIEPVKNAAGVVVDSTRYRVVKPGQKYWAYCLERFDPNSLSCRYALHPNIVGGGSEAVRSLASQGIHLFGLKIVPAVGQNPADVEADVEKRIQALRPGDSLTIDAESKEFYHRSPDAMIRYLGRLVGCQLRPGEYKGQTAEQCQAKTKRGDRFFTNDEPALFLVLSTDKKDGPKALEVEYGGGRFYVPANAKDRGFTLAVLGLVNQLISMQKKSDELPKTLAVQSVGG